MTPETKSAEVEPLVMSRYFDAPRELVFKAWSHADHIRRWFSPAGCEVPAAVVDFRVGGVFDYSMRLPDGSEHGCKGVFKEIMRPERLVIEFDVYFGDRKGFTALTELGFVEEGGGCRMNIRQSYVFHDPAFKFAATGAPEGWRTTLDKLDAELARIKQSPRTSAHGAFTIRRNLSAAPDAVYRALTDKEAKARWFAGSDGMVTLERAMDVRVGGRERLRTRWTNGVVSTFDATYFDVIPDERLVYAYEMRLDDRKISVSLATMQLEPDGAGTRLTVTEQGVFLDGYDDAGSREHGTGWLLDKLAAHLN